MLFKRRPPGVVPWRKVNEDTHVTCDLFIYPDGTSDSSMRAYDNLPGFWEGPGPEVARIPTDPFVAGDVVALRRRLQWVTRRIIERGWLIIEVPPGPDVHPDVPARCYLGHGGDVWGFHVAIPVMEAKR